MLMNIEHIAGGLNYMPSNTRVVLVDQKFDCSNSPYNFTSKFVWENSDLKIFAYCSNHCVKQHETDSEAIAPYTNQ